MSSSERVGAISCAIMPSVHANQCTTIVMRTMYLRRETCGLGMERDVHGGGKGETGRQGELDGGGGLGGDDGNGGGATTSAPAITPRMHANAAHEDDTNDISMNMSMTRIEGTWFGRRVPLLTRSRSSSPIARRFWRRGGCAQA